MTEKTGTDIHALAVTFFSEILATEQMLRNRLSRVLPKGMELSHFSVLNHLAYVAEERSPAQLAKTFHVTRGAMTNTLAKLEWAGHIHIRPDWDDARRKMVAISPSGRQARDAAIRAITPLIHRMVDDMGGKEMRTLLPVLRDLRIRLENEK
ncbi:MarR family winged helix-turn-helix transcriptional regulator [Chachezhania sediminis]|uniref:MarR family winged helix-turn-helix transcriptional regulator n=1 Tax=Chachezhania sediminis TaxID=2599291 RepID=UPI00131C6969|nr:MarR family transcriptional regulator [Chachezhania sediminis]